MSIKRFGNPLRSWFLRWLGRRLPASSQIELAHRSLFILPSGFGLAYLCTTLALYILATNYENNLALFLTFAMLSLFVVAILFSFINVAGLSLNARETHTGEVGQIYSFEIILSSDKPRYAIELTFSGQKPTYIARMDAGTLVSGVPFYPLRRGWCAPGRLILTSYYPLGLFRVWSELDLNQKAMIHPHSESCNLGLGQSSVGGEEAQSAAQAVDAIEEFHGLRLYKTGESLARVAWKHYAMGRGMFTKEFEQPHGEPCWLALERVTGADLESRIAKLAYWVRKLSRQQQRFGLDLHGHTLGPDSGATHARACLDALALYRGS